MTDGRRAHLDGWAVASLLLCAALWGVNQSASKVAVAEIPPLLQAALRSTGAALLLGLFTLVAKALLEWKIQSLSNSRLMTPSMYG